MNENINLCEILKDCPKGTKLYSTVLGNVSFDGMQGTCDNDFDYCILVSAMTRYDTITQMELTREGHFNNLFPEAECVLWPSKDVRTWVGWKYPKPKKLKFDPKTLNPFDKVLVKIDLDNAYLWMPNIFSSYSNNLYYTIGGGCYRYILPYNYETKYLSCTTYEAPDYYKYWED